MVPIFEQGKGNGIGHSFNTLIAKFIEIGNEHLASKRAKAFAFILYDFQDIHVKKILRNQGGFAQLDRLSGTDLSVFYLHSGDERLFKAFNDVFLGAFEIDKIGHRLPLVLFFKIADNEVTSVEVVELEQTNMMFAFKELYEIIENYIARVKNKDVKPMPVKTNKLVEFLKSTRKIAIERFIKWLMDKGIEYSGQYI